MCHALAAGFLRIPVCLGACATGFWQAGNEGMEKKTTVMGYIGNTISIHSVILS